MHLRYAAALLALVSGLAHADNISLRVSYSDGPKGVDFVPVHAEVGKFALTPDIQRGQEGDDWLVVAYDAKGKVLHQVSVANGTRRHVEAFDPKTGKIVRSEYVHHASDVFEVSLPYNANTARIDVLPASTGIKALSAAQAPLARFDRRALDYVLGTSRPKQRMAANAAAAAPATATTVLSNGSPSNHMDFVFVGDGYTGAEMGKWRADAQRVIEGFIADPLFKANQASLNVHRVDVASNQSGADELDRGVYVDTAMDGAFACQNNDRTICVNYNKVYDIVGSVLQPGQRDVIIVVSNSTRYGGGGGPVATMSMSEYAIELALHEVGHTAFALTDEYYDGTCSLQGEPAAANASLDGSRGVKWGDLISSSTPVPTQPGAQPNGTVGVFQGAQYCASGKYRPTENSRMRTLGYPWHAVNERRVATVIAKYTASIGPTQTQTGTLGSGGWTYAPSAAPGSVQAGSGTVKAQLTGPSNANFDLYLNRWNGSAWVTVATSKGPTSSESISYDGFASDYYFEIRSSAGSGNYTLQYSFPQPK